MADSTMRVRKTVNALSATQKANYVAAVLKLKNSTPSADPSIPPNTLSDAGNVYDWYVHLHKIAMSQPVHGRPWFLPWHRQFILNFENAIRLLGPDPEMALPYWDWAGDAASSSPATRPVWGDDFLGGNGAQPFATTGDKAGDVSTGAFKAGAWTLNVKPSPDEQQPPAGNNNLRRSFGNFDPANAGKLPSQADVDHTLTMATYDTSPWDATSVGSFRNTAEGFLPYGMHNQLHVWVGGSMLPMTSPNDPVFFLHHCNLDRIWSQWQDAHPAQTYQPAVSPSNPPPNGDPWVPADTKIGGDDGMWPWQGTPLITPNGTWKVRELGYVYDVLWPVFTPFAIPMTPIGVPRNPVNNHDNIPWDTPLFSASCTLMGVTVDTQAQSISTFTNGIFTGLRLVGPAIANGMTQYFCLRGLGAVNQHPGIHTPGSYDFQWLQMWNGQAFVDGNGNAGVVPIGPQGDCWFRRKPGARNSAFALEFQDGMTGVNDFTMWTYVGEGLPDH